MIGFSLLILFCSLYLFKMDWLYFMVLHDLGFYFVAHGLYLVVFILQGMAFGLSTWATIDHSHWHHFPIYQGYVNKLYLVMLMFDYVLVIFRMINHHLYFIYTYRKNRWSSVKKERSSKVEVSLCVLLYHGSWLWVPILSLYSSCNSLSKEISLILMLVYHKTSWWYLLFFQKFLVTRFYLKSKKAVFTFYWLL